MLHGGEHLIFYQCCKAILRKELLLEIDWSELGQLQGTLKAIQSPALICSLSILKENNGADYCLALELQLAVLKQ